MKFIPMLFSTTMVQAIREGRKTQTRRKIKGEALNWLEVSGFEPDFVSLPENNLCPYGQPGDVIWVRETFRVFSDLEDAYSDIVEYAADNPPYRLLVDGDGFSEYNKDGSEKTVPFTPSIHMPKKYARIFLKIVSVRVERLQDIYENDAKAEGVISYTPVPGDGPTVFKDYEHGRHLISAYSSFASLWRSINGAESWDVNPWVWVIDFVVIDKPENFLT